MIKIQKTMATDIKEILFVYDNEGSPLYKIFFNNQEEVIITNDIDDDDPYAVYLPIINKKDWEEIKSFIDKII